MDVDAGTRESFSLSAALFYQITGGLKASFSPVGRLLGHYDVLQLVFEALVGNSEVECRSKLLKSALLVCKAFYEPGVDVLWKELPTVLPALRLLPNFAQYQHQNSFVSARVFGRIWTFFNIDFSF